MKFIAALICLLSLGCTSKSGSETTALRPVSSFFPEHKTQVLVVGTFHFNYPGLDAHKTDEKDRIDVLKEPWQGEVLELVAYIKKFKPTKIGIEAMDSWQASEKLKLYKEGNLILGRDEREQLGLRLASDLGLDTIYSLDAGSFAADIEEMWPEFAGEFFKDYDWQSDDPLEKNYAEHYSYQDALSQHSSILEKLKYLNAPDLHRYDYGAYLIGDFKLGNHRGADILATYWYNRNLRIFRKIQDISSSAEDRILLIIGNGHAALLRQFLEASPEFEFVEFGEL